MGDGRVDPLRFFLVPMGARRERIVAECHQLLDEIAAVDAALGELAARRHRLVEALRLRRATMAPKLRHGPARQPTPDGAARLPPLAFRATKLWGRLLRDACVRILRAAGALSLPELHAQLHHHGFEIHSPHPVKALGDAMGYELQRGRVRRPARGVYAPIRGAVANAEPPRTPCGRLDHVGEVIGPQAA